MTRYVWYRDELAEVERVGQRLVTIRLVRENTSLAVSPRELELVADDDLEALADEYDIDLYESDDERYTCTGEDDCGCLACRKARELGGW